MTTTLSAHDRTVIDRDTRCRSIETTTPPTSAAQLDQALALAVALYETAAAHGVDKATADGVTSFVDAAVEGIRARDRRPVADQCPQNSLPAQPPQPPPEHGRPSIGSTRTKETTQP